MQCSFCEQLRRELRMAAQQEARATLQQRASSFPGVQARGIAEYTALQDQVQASRRKQIELARKLEEHLEAEHDAAAAALT